MEYLGPLGTTVYPPVEVHGGDSSDIFSANIVNTAVQGFKKAVFEQNIVPWKFHPKDSDFEPSINATKTYITSITLSQPHVSPENISRPLGASITESYGLYIPENGGNASITAPSALGPSRGLTTLSQLFYPHSDARDVAYTPFAPATVTDHPVFRHRGLNLDVSRNYYPICDILRTIDALAYNKFNRLHLHITDAQSWPLVIDSLPDLATKGAYTPELVYTPKDVHQIQMYGALRGVEVGLEIDMPGHTSSIHHSDPSLIAAYNKLPNWSLYCAEPPCGTLKLNSTAVPLFLTKLFDDLLPRVSTLSSYFHTGGDEVNFEAYSLDETVKSSDPTEITGLLQKFFDFVHGEVVGKHGMTQIVWEEMLLEYEIEMPKDVVVQSWKSSDSVRQIVERGYQAIAGNYDVWYLDCGHGAWTDYKPGQQSAAQYPYLDYCGPLHNWRQIYAYDPLASIPSSLHPLVIGGEASLWSEQTDGTSIDGVIWPRLAAAGEVLWGGAKDPGTGGNRSQIEAAPRLGEMRERLVKMGVRAAGVSMPWCSMREDGVEACGWDDGT